MNSHYEKLLATGEVKCIDDEIPFEIPQGWEWCRLSDIVILLSGRDLDPTQYNSVSNGIPYMTGASNFKNGYLIKNRWTNAPVVISMLGDLLITCKGTIGEMAFNTIGDIHIARQIMAIRSSFVDLNYIQCYLCANIQALQKQANSMIPGISRDTLLNALIPLPPLEEQLRIVAKIEELLPLVKNYERAQNELDSLNALLNEQLHKSILQEAIQGRLVPQNPNDEPASGLLQRIHDEKLRLVRDGKMKQKDVVDSVIFRGDDNKYYERTNKEIVEIELLYDYPDNWSVLKLKDICQLVDGEKRTGKGICLDAKYLRGKSSPAYLESGKFVRTNDNIILVDGENSGEVFTVPHDGYMGSTFKQLWVSENMHLPYVLYFIQFYKDLLRNSKKGAAIPHLNKEIFYSLTIGIPPYQEQKRITKRINDLFQLLK